MKLYMTLEDGDDKVERVLLTPITADLNEIVDDMAQSLVESRT